MRIIVLLIKTVTGAPIADRFQIASHITPTSYSFFYLERVLNFLKEIIKVKYLLPILLHMCYIVGG